MTPEPHRVLKQHRDAENHENKGAATSAAQRGPIRSNPRYSSWESLCKVSDKGHNFALFFLPYRFQLTPSVLLCVIFIVTYKSLSRVSRDLLLRDRLAWSWHGNFPIVETCMALS